MTSHVLDNHRNVGNLKTCKPVIVANRLQYVFDVYTRPVGRERVKWNWCIPSRFIDRKPKVWRRRWRHNNDDTTRVMIPTTINFNFIVSTKMEESILYSFLHEYSCQAPPTMNTMNNYKNKLSCWYIEQRNYLSFHQCRIISNHISISKQSWSLTALPGSSQFAKMLKGDCLFDLILYVPSTIFQLNRDETFWVEPVLS